MKRVFAYNEPECGRRYVTEDWVWKHYYPGWKIKMFKKHGEDSDLVNFENCLKDWKTVHWAWEVVDD